MPVQQQGTTGSLNYNPQTEKVVNATTIETEITTTVAQLQQVQQVGNITQNSSQQTQTTVGTIPSWA